VVRGPLGAWARRAWAWLQAPVVRWPVGLLAVAGYVLVSLWPFTWDPPRNVANGARLEAGVGLRFLSPGLAVTSGPPAWLDAAIRSGRLEISLRVRPLLTRQSGPARILSVAGNGFERNLAIDQKGDDLMVYLRSPGAGDATGDAERVARARDVLQAGSWLDVALNVAPGTLTLRAGDDRPIRLDLAPDPLRTWDAMYRLTFGNEISGSHPWLGDIGHVVVRTPDAMHAYPEAEPLQRPATFWIMSREPKLEPFRHLQTRDAVNNLVMYLPLGLFLGMASRPDPRRAAIAALLLIAGLSASMEVAQIFISVRNPSINDFILNVAGGAAGYALSRWLARRAERAWSGGRPLAGARPR